MVGRLRRIRLSVGSTWPCVRRGRCVSLIGAALAYELRAFSAYRLPRRIVSCMMYLLSPRCLAPRLCASEVDSVINLLFIECDWERKNIVIKDKKTEIGRWLQQTILNLRCLLIQEKIGELQNQTAESHIETHREILEEVNDYVGLKKNLSNRLDRVIF